MRSPFLLVLLLTVFVFGCSPGFQRQKYTDFDHIRGKRLKSPLYAKPEDKSVHIPSDDFILREQPEAVDCSLPIDTLPVTEETTSVSEKNNSELTTISEELTDKDDDSDEKNYVPYTRREKAVRIAVGSISLAGGIVLLIAAMASIPGLVAYAFIPIAFGLVMIVIAFRGKKATGEGQPSESLVEGDDDFKAAERDFRFLAMIAVGLTVLSGIVLAIALLLMIEWIILVAGAILLISMFFSFTARKRWKVLKHTAREKSYYVNGGTRALGILNGICVVIHVSAILFACFLLVVGAAF